MKKLFIYSILVNFFFLSVVTADDKDACSIRIEEGLLSDFEKRIYNYYPDLLRGFVICDVNFLDRLVGMLHEGLHFLDLNYKDLEQKIAQVESGELAFTHTMLYEDAVIHFKDGTEINDPQFGQKLIAPQDILNDFFDSNTVEKSAQFSDLYYDYIYGSEDSPGSGNTMYPGLVMEWSAYLHGYDFSIPRAQSLIRPINQGEGFIFFVLVTELYLNQLEEKYPEQIQMIKDSPEAMSIIKKLESESKNVLNSFDYCSEYQNGDSVLMTVPRLPRTNTIGSLTNSEIDLNQMLNSCFE